MIDYEADTSEIEGVFKSMALDKDLKGYHTIEEFERLKLLSGLNRFGRSIFFGPKKMRFIRARTAKTSKELVNIFGEFNIFESTEDCRDFVDGLYDKFGL